MYRDVTNLKDADAYAAALERIYEVTSCSNWDELSEQPVEKINFQQSVQKVPDARKNSNARRAVYTDIHKRFAFGTLTQ